MSINLIHNDGRRGRDADGDGIYDEKSKKAIHKLLTKAERKDWNARDRADKINRAAKVTVIRDKSNPYDEKKNRLTEKDLRQFKGGPIRWEARLRGGEYAVTLGHPVGKTVFIKFSDYDKFERNPRAFLLRMINPTPFPSSGVGGTLRSEMRKTGLATHADGRKGRDADGDGIYDEKGKNITKTHRVLKGGFILRKPNPKKRKARGWRIVKGAHKAIEKVAKREAVMAAKDIPLVGVQKKRGINFQEPIDRKSLSPRDRDRLDRGLPVKTGFKPGEAYKFKTIKVDKNAPRFRMTGKGKKVLLGQVLRGRPLEYDEKALKKAIRTAVTKKMSDLPRFNRETKIDYLVDNNVFMEKDLPWLHTLNNRQLDILIISNYGTSDGVKKSWTTRKRMGGGFSGTYRKEVNAPETEEERRRRLNVRRRAARGRWADSMFGPKP